MLLHKLTADDDCVIWLRAPEIPSKWTLCWYLFPLDIRNTTLKSKCIILNKASLKQWFPKWGASPPGPWSLRFPDIK